MDEQHCFEDCPACGGTGNLPTGAGDYNECGWSKYWDEMQALRKRLEAVERENKRLAMCVLSGSNNDEMEGSDG